VKTGTNETSHQQGSRRFVIVEGRYLMTDRDLEYL